MQNSDVDSNRCEINLHSCRYDTLWYTTAFHWLQRSRYTIGTWMIHTMCRVLGNIWSVGFNPNQTYVNWILFTRMKWWLNREKVLKFNFIASFSIQLTVRVLVSFLPTHQPDFATNQLAQCTCLSAMASHESFCWQHFVHVVHSVLWTQISSVEDIFSVFNWINFSVYWISGKFNWRHRYLPTEW